jgi:hypothetical protein
VQALIAGTQKHFPNDTLRFGTPRTRRRRRSRPSKAWPAPSPLWTRRTLAFKDAGVALRGIETTVGPLMRDFKRFILAAFGSATQTLADFGLQPPKARKPLTSEQRAVRLAKIRATRKARRTTSRKQKLAVKGDVTGVTITPVTHASASSPSATPVDPASNGARLWRCREVDGVRGASLPTRSKRGRWRPLFFVFSCAGDRNRPARAAVSSPRR